MLRGKTMFVWGVLLLVFNHTVLAQNMTDSGKVYTLKQCVDSALKNNPTVRQVGFTAESAHINYEQQRANMLPSISASGNYGTNGGKSVNNNTNSYVNTKNNSFYGQVSGSLTLFNGFAIQNFIRQYALNYEADKMDWQQAKDQMTVNVIVAYLNVLSTKEQLNLAQQQMEATRRKVDLLDIQNREGAIAPSDFSDIKGQLASDELTMISTKNALEAYKLALAQFMNIPYSPVMQVESLGEDLTPVAYDMTVDQIYQNARNNLAQVKAASLHLASAEKAVKATRGAMAPTLSFQGQANTAYSSIIALQGPLLSTTFDQTRNYVLVNGSQLPLYSPNDKFGDGPKVGFRDQFNNNVSTFYGLVLNVPILNGFRLRSQYKLAQVTRDQADFNAKTTLITLRQSVESYYVTMMSDFRTYNVLAKQVQNYEESYHAAEIKYDAGALKSVDYIIYKTNLDRARLNFVASKYNYILQTKVLDYFQGRLTW